MTIPIESIRFKEIRHSLKLTQASFAEKLELGSTTVDIERGRTKLSGFVVAKLLEDYMINPLWLYGKSDQKFLKPNRSDIAPKIISVSEDTGTENIVLVNQKAAAGYAGNIGDPSYFRELPAFTFPLPQYRNATFRGFQIEGYSMMPAVRPDEWILVEAIENIDQIKNGGYYIIVDQEGVRFKKIENDPTTNFLTLISINREYTPDKIAYTEVQEIWKFHSKISFQLEGRHSRVKLEEIHKDILEIKERVEGMG